MDISPLPKQATGTEGYLLVSAHEFVHQWQFSSGDLSLRPFGTEGAAVGIELDTKISEGVFLAARSGQYPAILTNLVRGNLTMVTNEALAPAYPILTYGMGIFWNYIQTQFDFNNQTMRRMIDILSSETAQPLFKSYDYPYMWYSTVLNNTGASAALKQSFEELFSKDIKDVWNNFSISLVLLRNNESIPLQYRTIWPFWIYNTNYPGFPMISAASEILGTQFANWWEVFDTNTPIPASWNVYAGQTFIPTLPANTTRSIKNLTSLSYTVPNNTNKITITISKGEWRLTLLQFTSDGTPVGNFIMDGPHTIVGTGEHVFDVANHAPAFTSEGSIRLVCSNVTFSGTGMELADYLANEPTTGTIKIVRS